MNFKVKLTEYLSRASDHIRQRWDGLEPIWKMAVALWVLCLVWYIVLAPPGSIGSVLDALRFVLLYLPARLSLVLTIGVVVPLAAIPQKPRTLEGKLDKTGELANEIKSLLAELDSELDKARAENLRIQDETVVAESLRQAGGTEAFFRHQRRERRSSVTQNLVVGVGGLVAGLALSFFNDDIQDQVAQYAAEPQEVCRLEIEPFSAGTED